LFNATVYEGNTLFSAGFPTEVNATLKDAAGSPIAGRTISFSTGREHFCTATTNAGGYAACDGFPVGRGYTASFAGDETYSSSEAEGFAADLWAADLAEVHVLGDGYLLRATVH
jgi:hypothetical protein